MLVLLFASLFLVMLILHLLWPSVIDLTEAEKCPACYGVSLCPAITRGLLNLDSFGAATRLVNMLGSKNVLFGMLGSQKVVLKKLGNVKELEQLDKVICEKASLGSSCRVNEAVLLQGDLLQSMRLHVASQYGSLLLCPAVTNLVHLFSNIFYKNRDVSTTVLLANIWTIVMINPEPLLLQVCIPSLY
jgi:hypothetical protein